MLNKKINLLILFVLFICILSISIGYSALNSQLTISGEAVVEINEQIKITNISFKNGLNGGIETYNSSFNNDTSNIFIHLPNSNSSITYTITVFNEIDSNFYFAKIDELINSNESVSYEIVNMDDIVFAGNSATEFDIVFSYKGALPENKDLSLSLKFTFESIYNEEILDGSTPVLNNGLIPVSISSNGDVSVANIQEAWYSYESKIWANAVLVKNPSITYASGDVIPMDDIKQMYVWIPRYSYDVNSIENENNAIDITFVNNSIAAHPAFTFGTDELNGLWVGKFETGYEFGEDMNSTSTDFSVKPNVFSIGPMSTYNMYINIIKSNNKFGLDSSSDMHVIKNTEWGAVSYLTHSIYGICTSDTSCIPIVNNYFQNNVSDIITGCGGGTSPTTTNYVYDISICPEDYRWNTTNGYKASTTKNISGVYDMSAGKYEYVMAFMENSAGGFHFRSSTFTVDNMPDEKYYDLYPENLDTTDSSTALVGDAILEIKDPASKYTWNTDYAIFHVPSSPFIVRSGRVGGWHFAGMFSYYGVTGSSSGGVGAFSTRNVIAAI